MINSRRRIHAADRTCRTARFPLRRKACKENDMKATLRPGVSRTNRYIVDRDRTIGFMGEEGRVYATPAMVWDVENTCRDLIMEHAEPGEDSVGVAVAVTHVAPTLLGMSVEITVRVSAVEGRRISLEAVARDEMEEIGRGTHSRVVVDVGKTYERLKAKAAKRNAANTARVS
jgi:fluoroacetyl-CoA thioesterase